MTPIHHRWPSLLFLTLIASTLLDALSTEANETRKPNVLFIALDDLRPELGCYGQTHIHSPNIDRLAASGVLFDRAYCQYPVCNASRASILTGLRPDSTGVYDNKTHFRKQAPDVVALPQHFKDHGYQTQALGKIYHGAFETAYVGRAFDDPLSWNLGHWYGSPQYYFSPHGIEVARQVYAKKFNKSGAALDGWTTEFVQGLATEAPEVADETLYDGEMTDRAIAALNDLKAKPFFLAVGYLKPHLPFVAPKKYWDLYDPASIELPKPASAPEAAPAIALQNGGEVRGQYIDMRGKEPLNAAQSRALRHGYYACVSYVDAQIGRLLDELDRLGLRENTIIVLWGDHGWHLGEQGLWGKLTDFELATRVPLIISAPRKKAMAAKSPALVELVDVYPTLCELSGLPLPSHLEGTSLAPLLEVPVQSVKTAAFSQVVHGSAVGRSMRTDRYRLTRWTESKAPHQSLAIELYDYQQSPIEVENIAARPENSALLAELTARLEAGWKTPPQAAAPLPVEFSVELETVLKQDDGKFLWFHPRAAAIPSQDGTRPRVVMTLQKHLRISDYYSGLHVMHRPSSSTSWSGPILPPELDWRTESDGVTISVADVTPGWHAPTEKLLAIGCQVRYSPQGKQLEDVPRAHQTVYSVFDPKTEKWTPWQVLALPEGEQFDFARNACSQWLVKPDGKLLVPLYIARSAKDLFRTTVAECHFDGLKLEYTRNGTVLELNEKRGLYEPSVIAFRGRYFLTMRNDRRGYASVSDDGLNFIEPTPWLFDDGEELGSYNTQQHWLAHSDGLFLVYTRRGANNDHIVRHRAPLFMAQVNPDTLRVMRKTETVVVPERGAELGNFGACAVSESESWVTVAEGLFMKDSRARGAEGATFVARIRWAKPNRLALSTD